MSLYTNRMTLIVPELMIEQANQMALIAGESAADVNTFTHANWTDASGNLYAVCSTVIKPIVLQMLKQPIAGSNYETLGADIAIAQQALDASIIYAKGMKATPKKTIIAVDTDPMQTFAELGLTRVLSEIAPA